MSKPQLYIQYTIVNLSKQSYDIMSPRYDCAFIGAVRENYGWDYTDYLVGVPNDKSVHIKRCNSPQGIRYPDFVLTDIEVDIVANINDENQPPFNSPVCYDVPRPSSPEDLLESF